MTASISAPPLPMRTKLGFGIGSMAETILGYTISGYLLFYYNQVLGLSATLAGLAITASILVDCLVDPLIGSLSDRTRSRWGRRHPYMFFAPIPVAISLFAVFHPPPGLEGPWLFVWGLASIVSMRVLSSVYHVPHLALGGELATDFTERSRVMSYSYLASSIGAAGAGFIALTVFFHATPQYPRGLMNPHAYGPFALAAATVVLLIHYTSAWFTRDRIPLMAQPPADDPGFSASEFFKDVGRAFSNKNYVFLLLGVLCFSLMASIRSGISLYLNTFFWGLGSEQIRWFSLAISVGGIASFAVAARLHRLVGKRTTMALFAFLVGVVPAIPQTLRLLGLAPANGSPILLPILALSMAFAAFGGGLVAITNASAIGDIADENELRYGIRQEGVMYSTRTVFTKLEAAAGQFFVGVLLDLVHFPRGLTAGAIDPHTLRLLGVIDGPLLILPGTVAAILYAQYALTESRHQETRRLLDLAKAEQQQPPPAKVAQSPIPALGLAADPTI